MRRVGMLLGLAIALLGCGEDPTPTSGEPRDVATPTVAPELAPDEPEDSPPAIPGLLLDNLTVAGEGSFALPEGAEALTLRAAVALDDGLALVGDADFGDRRSRWIGFVPERGPARASSLDAGTIRAAIGDGDGGALLAGSGGVEQAWFGALDGRARLTADVELDAADDVVAVLAGREGDERALVLGGRGWALSLHERGQMRRPIKLGELGDLQVHAGARLASDELLVIGSTPDQVGQAAWSRVGEAQFQQGEVAIEAADPHRTLDAIVTLDHDMGFIALGRATRELDVDPHHDQVIAVGFDRLGQPTWSRVLPHLRAIEIYGGAIHRSLPGVAHFVAKIPVGGEPSTALGWIEVCPGVDGIVFTRQIAGTLGWESAGFVDGRDDGAILAWTRTEAGIDWRVLLVRTDHLWGPPR